MNELEETVILIVANIMDVSEDEITLNSSVENVESWDSLNHLKLIVALEEEYNISIPEDSIFELNSVEDIVKYLETSGKK